MRQSLPNTVSCSCVAPCAGSSAVACRSSLCSQRGSVHSHGVCCMLEADLLRVASAQFFSTTASLHGLSDGGGAASAQLRWDLRVAAAGCTLALWYPSSAPAAAAAAAGAGRGGNLALGPAALGRSAAEQCPAEVLVDGGQREQSATNDEDTEAFSQPGDSLMLGGGESFMSAASQLRGSSAAVDSTAAAVAAAANAAGTTAASAEPAATRPAVAAASPDEEDYGRLELECTDVIVDVSAGGNAGGVSAAVRLYALSALEYLPSGDAACVTACLLISDGCCCAVLGYLHASCRVGFDTPVTSGQCIA